MFTEDVRERGKEFFIMLCVWIKEMYGGDADGQEMAHLCRALGTEWSGGGGRRWNLRVVGKRASPLVDTGQTGHWAHHCTSHKPPVTQKVGDTHIQRYTHTVQ